MRSIGLPELIFLVLLGALVLYLRRRFGRFRLGVRRCAWCGQRIPDLGSYCPLCGQKIG